MDSVGLAFGKLAWEKAARDGGGAPSVNVTVEYVDTEADPGKAIECSFTGWFHDRVGLVVGSAWSSSTLPVAQLGSSIGGALLDWGSTSGELSSPSYPLYVRVSVPDSELAVGMAQLLVLPSGYNYSRLAIIYDTDAWGQGLAGKLVETMQRIRPNAYLKQVPLQQAAAPGTEPVRQRLRTLKGSMFRIFVALTLHLAVLEVLAEAEFVPYISGPSFFLFTHQDIAVFLVQLTAQTLLHFKGLQTLGPGRAKSNSTLRTNLERQWLSLSLDDLPEPVRSWTSCVGGTSSATPSCSWRAGAMFQDVGWLDDVYFTWAVDAMWLLHTAVQDLVNQGTVAGAIKGALLTEALTNASVIGLDGPVRFTDMGDRALTVFVLRFLDEQGTLTAFGRYDSFSGTFDMSRLPVYADGSTTRPKDFFDPCLVGYFRDGDSCEPAPVGSYSPQGTLTEPLLCPPGSVAASAGQAQCTPCQAGRYSAEPGGAACSDCAPGTYGDRAGRSGCDLCMLGYQADAAGHSECERCPRGRYADSPGSVRCASCPEEMSTQDVAARSATECQCVEGLFLDGERCAGAPEGTVCAFGSRGLSDCRCGEGYFGALGLCQRCGDGMACDAVGLQSPRQAAGYYLQLAGGDPGAGTASFSAYACYDHLQCPLGAPGGCVVGRVGLACGRCQDGHYVSRGGACAVCTPRDTVPAVAVGCAALVAVLPLYLLACPDVSQRSLNFFTVTIVVSQLIFAVQALGVFAGLRVRWTDPIATLLRLLQVVQLDFDLLKAQCLIGSERAVTKSVGEMLLFPAFSAYLAVVAAFLHILRWRRLSLTRYVNVGGMVALALNIPLTLAVMRPFYCVASPNGTRHVAVHPDVLCWQSDEHKVLVAVGVLGILAYPVANFCLVTSITWRFTSLLSRDHGLRTLQKFRFLFDRFAPHRYYYALLYLWRCMLLPIIPVLLPDSGVGQVMSVMLLLYAASLGAIALQPWATHLGNVTEVVILSAVLVVAQASAFLVSAEADGGATVIGMILFILLVVTGALGMVVILLSISRRFTQSDQYAVFLCHHKHGAGVLARLCKVHLAKYTARPIFLDSDELRQLTVLFDIVRTRTRVLVALMTKYTLERMWCAGELTTAVRNKVPIVMLVCEDYVPLLGEDLAQFGAHWSAEEKATLATSGVPLTAVREAYRHLGTLDPVGLDRFGSRAHHLERIEEVADRCALRSKGLCGMTTSSSFMSHRSTSADAKVDVVVSGCRMQAEARCVCYILSEQLQVELRERVRPAFRADEARPMAPHAKYLVAVLTRGLLFDADFAQVLLVLHKEHKVEIVTALADTMFEFPGPSQFGEIEEMHKGTAVVASIKHLVKCLALPYSPHGSEGLLKTQLQELAQRINLRNLQTQGKKPVCASHDAASRPIKFTCTEGIPVCKL